MSEKYKIGDISKLLGIPVQTLRYYEERGIVSPHKDDMTGYRYYDAWDLNNLLDAVYYRALDFTLSQTQEILNSDDLYEIQAKYENQETILLQKIQDYKRMLEIVSKQKKKITNFKDHINKFDINRGPELLFSQYRLKNSFQSKEGDTNIQNLKLEMNEWMDEIPNVVPTFIITQASLDNIYENMQYWWGWSMPMEEALNERMQINNYNEYIPACKCIHTIFEAKEEGTFAKAFYENVYNKINKTEYAIKGNPIGQLVMKAHDKNGLHRYFEVWIPIDDKEE